MVHRAVAMPDVKRAGDGGADIGFAAADGVCNGRAFRQFGGDTGREGAAGAVRVRPGAARAVEGKGLVCEEYPVAADGAAALLPVAALDDHAFGAERKQAGGSAGDIRLAADGLSAEQFRFGQVGGTKDGARQ